MPAFPSRFDERAIRPRPIAVPGPRPAPARSDQDVRFLDLLSAYRRFGGLATGAEIAARRPHTGLSDLARAIAARDVVSLDWSGQRWMPVFQFEHGDLAVRAPVRRLVDELAGVLDDADVAQWFVEPNAWLGDAAPLLCIDTDYPRVHDAARALRFACRS